MVHITDWAFTYIYFFIYSFTSCRPFSPGTFRCNIQNEFLVCPPTATDFLRGFVKSTALLLAKVSLSSDVWPKRSPMQDFAKVAESCLWFHSPLQAVRASYLVLGQWVEGNKSPLCAWMQLWTVSYSCRQCQSKGGASHPDPSGRWKRWPHAKRDFQTPY